MLQITFFSLAANMLLPFATSTSADVKWQVRFSYIITTRTIDKLLTRTHKPYWMMLMKKDWNLHTWLDHQIGMNAQQNKQNITFIIVRHWNMWSQFCLLINQILHRQLFVVAIRNRPLCLGRPLISTYHTTIPYKSCNAKGTDRRQHTQFVLIEDFRPSDSSFDCMLERHRCQNCKKRNFSSSCSHRVYICGTLTLIWYVEPLAPLRSVWRLVHSEKQRQRTKPTISLWMWRTPLCFAADHSIICGLNERIFPSSYVFIIIFFNSHGFNKNQKQ